MPSSIIESGPIFNESGPSQNPRETEMFIHQIKFLPDPSLFGSTISWLLQGDVPKGLSINSSGLISGEIAPMLEQPSIDNSYKGEPIPFSGGLDKLPGSSKQTHIFNFSAVWNFMEFTAPDHTVILPRQLSTSLSITLVRNNDITNRLYIEKYFESEKTKKENGSEEAYNYHTLSYKGKIYDRKNREDFFKTHPGPFRKL